MAKIIGWSKIKKNFPKIENICILDLDILINPFAPNIFEFIKKNKINLTSLRKICRLNTKNNKKMAFLEKNIQIKTTLLIHY